MNCLLIVYNNSLSSLKQVYLIIVYFVFENSFSIRSSFRNYFLVLQFLEMYWLWWCDKLGCKQSTSDGLQNGEPECLLLNYRIIIKRRKIKNLRRGNIKKNKLFKKFFWLFIYHSFKNTLTHSLMSSTQQNVVPYECIDFCCYKILKK